MEPTVSHDVYENPLTKRYASKPMAELWSEQRKHSTWRRLWVALAEAERELGIEISESQISDLRSATDDIDFMLAAKYEKELRHDVMAHVHAYGDRCPSARGIIHLGATSCYVTDNTDLILMREALRTTGILKCCHLDAGNDRQRVRRRCHDLRTFRMANDAPERQTR